MPVSAAPYGEKTFERVRGRAMARIDRGAGPAIVFQHGNPTSSYLWRNVMPHCEGLGRLVACDLIGMGDSEKIAPSGPDAYGYAEQRDHLFALWDRIDLGGQVVLVLHDWGSALGFDWASRNPDRVRGIAYMEAIIRPLAWEDWPAEARRVFQAMRSEAGEAMALEDNVFVERILPAATLRTLTEDEMRAYRAPFLAPGEGRRPTLSWPRQIPIDGEPPAVAAVVEAYGRWLAESPVPKLFVNAEPGSILTGRQREFCRTWPNQTEATVRGAHFVPEDSPDEIGRALAEWIAALP